MTPTTLIISGQVGVIASARSLHALSAHLVEIYRYQQLRAMQRCTQLAVMVVRE